MNRFPKTLPWDYRSALFTKKRALMYPGYPDISIDIYRDKYIINSIKYRFDSHLITRNKRRFLKLKMHIKAYIKQ